MVVVTLPAARFLWSLMDPISGGFVRLGGVAICLWKIMLFSDLFFFLCFFCHAGSLLKREQRITL